MNIFRKIANRFTVRGRALLQIDQGIVCAKKGETGSAIDHYSIVIGSLDSPKDLQAAALFNRSLAYAKIGEEINATIDLRAVLNMPLATSTVKRSAREKLVRIQRKQTREESR